MSSISTPTSATRAPEDQPHHPFLRGMHKVRQGSTKGNFMVVQKLFLEVQISMTRGSSLVFFIFRDMFDCSVSRIVELSLLYRCSTSRFVALSFYITQRVRIVL